MMTIFFSHPPAPNLRARQRALGRTSLKTRISARARAHTHTQTVEMDKSGAGTMLRTPGK